MEKNAGTVTKVNRSHELLSGSTLKLIAMITMLIDHIGATLVYNWWNTAALTQVQSEQIASLYMLLRQIGRSAFPIFCFLLCEGFFYTGSRGRYFLRLFFFALLSELPFDLAFEQGPDPLHQNVFFTLATGYLVIWGMDILGRKCLRYPLLRCAADFLLVCAGGLLADFLYMDYNIYGVLLIVIFYLLHDKRLLAGIAGYLCFLWEAWSLPAFLLIQFYNGKRGLKLKYVFYLFYPLHLFMLYLIGRVLVT